MCVLMQRGGIFCAHAAVVWVDGSHSHQQQQQVVEPLCSTSNCQQLSQCGCVVQQQQLVRTLSNPRAVLVPLVTRAVPWLPSVVF